MDLFGEVRPPPVWSGAVSLALVLLGESPKAWQLGETNDRAKARWVPKAEVTRGEGRDENIWTMPRWMAQDRGWL